MNGWGPHAPQPVSRPREVPPRCLRRHAAQLSLLSQCLVEVVNSLVGCRAEGSASAERLLADGGEGGRDCDLSEGGAVLRKGGADSSRSVYHRLQYTIDYVYHRLQPKTGTTTLTYDSP